MDKGNLPEEENLLKALLNITLDGKVNSGTFIQDETAWLTQQQNAGLFGFGRTVITRHLRNIFDSGELYENLVCAKKHLLFLTVKLTLPPSII